MAIATSVERLARIEEKQDAMREDMREMKQASKETNAILLAMHDRFLTIDRAEEMRTERNESIKELDARVTKLETWRSWIAGGVAVIGFLLGIGAEASRLWR